MKKLILLILSIFVLGQSFVMADMMLPNGESLGGLGPSYTCMLKRGTYIFGTCILNQTKQLIIGGIIIVILISGTFLYLRNRKTHTNDKPVS